MKRKGNAERRRRENRGAEGAEGLGSGEGYPPPQYGKGLGRPTPQFFWIFLSVNGAIWCILGACFNVSIRRVKQSRKAVLCANCQLFSYLIWRTYIVHDIIGLRIIRYRTYRISESAVSQSDTHAAYTMDIDIHVRATVYL